MSNNLDEIDRRILAELQADARATYQDLGKVVGLTGPSVFERVKKLEARGIIHGYRALVDAEAVGFGITAFVHVSQYGEADDCGTLAPLLAEIPEIEECHHIAGDDLYLLKVRTPSTAALSNLLTRIRQLGPGIRTRTTVVLETAFERRPLPVVAESE